jgi:hypothetical protein
MDDHHFFYITNAQTKTWSAFLLPATNSQNRTFFKKSAKRKCFLEIFDSQNLTKLSEKVHDF